MQSYDGRWEKMQIIGYPFEERLAEVNLAFGARVERAASRGGQVMEHFVLRASVLPLQAILRWAASGFCG